MRNNNEMNEAAKKINALEKVIRRLKKRLKVKSTSEQQLTQDNKSIKENFGLIIQDLSKYKKNDEQQKALISQLQQKIQLLEITETAAQMRAKQNEKEKERILLDRKRLSEALGKVKSAMLNVTFQLRLQQQQLNQQHATLQILQGQYLQLLRQRSSNLNVRSSAPSAAGSGAGATFGFVQTASQSYYSPNCPAPYPSQQYGYSQQSATVFYNFPTAGLPSDNHLQQVHTYYQNPPLHTQSAKPNHPS